MKTVKKWNRRIFIVGLMSTMLVTTLVMSLWQLTALASEAQISFDVNMVGARLILSGNDQVDNTEMQLTVKDTIYLSNTTDYDHVFTVSLDGAKFNATTAAEFADLIVLKTQDPMTVTVNEFRDDEFTFTISGGIFKTASGDDPDDMFVVLLNSTLNRTTSGFTASAMIESDFFQGGNVDLSLTVEKGFYAGLDEKMVLVPGESVTLAGKGIEISPIVTGSYLGGTQFKIEISRGFTFVPTASIKAISKGNAVTTGKVVDGAIVVEAPNTEAFSIQGIQIEATSASVGDVAEVRVTADGLSAYVTADEATKATDSASSSASFDQEEVIEEEVVEEEIEEVEEEIEEVVIEKLPKVEITIGAAAMKVNTVDIALDVPAYISNGYTMLPLRAVAELLRDVEVEWEADTQTAIVNIGDGMRVVKMPIGAAHYSVNGEQFTYTGTTAQINNGRTFVPIRDLAYAMDTTDVEWDSINRIAILNGSN